MRTLLTVLAGGAAWLAVALGVGTVFGRVIRLRDRVLCELDQADRADNPLID